MGGAMALRLVEKGHKVHVYDVNPDAMKDAVDSGAIGANSFEDFVSKLTPPRLVWLMIPSSHLEETLHKLKPLLAQGDVIIDGGNTWYEDSIRRAKECESLGIHFMDVGVSGGLSGARNGASMMIGGPREIFERLEPLFCDICVENGYGYMGFSGSGHRVKAIHNWVEYVMMAGIAEGLQAVRDAKEFNTDLGEVIKAWGHGSIVAGRLVTEWLSAAWKDDPGLKSFGDKVPYGETEGEMEKFMAQYPAPLLKAAVEMRARSRTKPGFDANVINALRKYFGGHTKDTASKRVV